METKVYDKNDNNILLSVINECVEYVVGCDDDTATITNAYMKELAKTINVLKKKGNKEAWGILINSNVFVCAMGCIVNDSEDFVEVGLSY